MRMVPAERGMSTKAGTQWGTFQPGVGADPTDPAAIISLGVFLLHVCLASCPFPGKSGCNYQRLGKKALLFVRMDGE